jgi:hypothetical protein
MPQLTISPYLNGVFTSSSQSQEFNVANKKDLGDKRLDLQGNFSASGSFGGGTLLLQGWDGAQWNMIASLSSAGVVRVGPWSALNYRVFLSGGTSPNVTWWLQSELWFEGSSSPPVLLRQWDANKSGASISLSNGNLTAGLPFSSSNVVKGVMALAGASSGKFYWEVTCDALYPIIGVAHANWISHLNDSNPPADSNCFGYYSFTGNLLHGFTAFGSTYGGGDVVGTALDLDNHMVWFSKNGVWQASGDPAAGTNPAYSTMPPNTGVYYPAIALQSLGTASQCTANFGDSTFAFSVPAGFSGGAPG